MYFKYLKTLLKNMLAFAIPDGLTSGNAGHKLNILFLDVPLQRFFRSLVGIKGNYISRPATVYLIRKYFFFA